jgi:hypothetical protein
MIINDYLHLCGLDAMHDTCKYSAVHLFEATHLTLVHSFRAMHDTRTVQMKA